MHLDTTMQLAAIRHDELQSAAARRRGPVHRPTSPPPVPLGPAHGPSLRSPP